MATILLPEIKTLFIAKLLATSTKPEDATKFGDAVEKYGNDNGFTTSATLLDDLKNDPKGFVDNDVIKTSGLKKGHATALKQMLEDVEKPVVEEPKPAPAHPAPGMNLGGNTSHYTIPSFPSEADKLMELLKKGGVFKGDAVTAVAGLQALLLRDMFNIRDLPQVLEERIEAFMESTEVDIDEDLALQIVTMSAQKRYGDVLEAFPNVTAAQITETRKKKLLARLEKLPAMLYQVHKALEAWNAEWKEEGGNLPAMFRTNDEFPLGKRVREAGEALNNYLTQAFRMLRGAPTARAMMAETIKLHEILSNKNLPGLIGASSTEDMISKLGLSMDITDVSFRRDISTFLRFVVEELPKLNAVEEGNALKSLYRLSRSIPWERFPNLVPPGKVGSAPTNGKPGSFAAPRRDGNNGYARSDRD